MSPKRNLKRVAAGSFSPSSGWLIVYQSLRTHSVPMLDSRRFGTPRCSLMRLCMCSAKRCPKDCTFFGSNSRMDSGSKRAYMSSTSVSIVLVNCNNLYLGFIKHLRSYLVGFSPTFISFNRSHNGFNTGLDNQLCTFVTGEKGGVECMTYKRFRS